MKFFPARRSSVCALASCWAATGPVVIVIHIAVAIMGIIITAAVSAFPVVRVRFVIACLHRQCTLSRFNCRDWRLLVVLYVVTRGVQSENARCSRSVTKAHKKKPLVEPE